MDMVKVTDRNCRTRPRTHGDGRGGQITFQPGEPREMTMADAALFIGNDAFLVVTAEGITLTKTEERIGDQLVMMRSDQVVAALPELTPEALAVRFEAATGSKPPAKAKREQLISALVAARVAGAAAPKGEEQVDADGNPIVPGDMND